MVRADQNVIVASLAKMLSSVPVGESVSISQISEETRLHWRTVERYLKIIHDVQHSLPPIRLENDARGNTVVRIADLSTLKKEALDLSTLGLSRDQLYLTCVSLVVERPLPLPLEHALVCYLKHSGLDFSYRFIWPFFCPRPDPAKFEWVRGIEAAVIEYPHSMALAEDLANLSAAGLLHMTRAHSLPTSLTSGHLALRRRDRYMDSFASISNMSGEELSQKVKAAIAHPRCLLHESYKLCISREM